MGTGVPPWITILNLNIGLAVTSRIHEISLPAICVECVAAKLFGEERESGERARASNVLSGGAKIHSTSSDIHTTDEI